MAKKEIDGVGVEEKSILTALRTIRMVCEDNEQCENCPLGDDRARCKVTEVAPRDLKIGEPDRVWRALS